MTPNRVTIASHTTSQYLAWYDKVLLFKRHEICSVPFNKPRTTSEPLTDGHIADTKEPKNNLIKELDKEMAVFGISQATPKMMDSLNGFDFFGVALLTGDARPR